MHTIKHRDILIKLELSDLNVLNGNFMMQSLVRIGEQIESLVDIIPLSSIRKRDDLSNVRALNVHDNLIRSIDHDVILLLPMLTRIDLSGNQVESMEGIHGAYNLVELNLSNNKISHVSHLVSLFHLRRLNLSYNRIRTLEGFQDVHGPNFELWSFWI
ncbi:hypothetical protein BC829DRAFT_65744 [Chytridium lagenaria]|nr:hypothetical protein BC829DRAFT_65744 [Chytridium lagenaria]